MSATHPPFGSLEANRVLRILLAITGTALCYVPFRLLLRNKQYAGVTLIMAVALMNSLTVLNASIWPNDNYTLWWHGHGFCDMQVYLAAPLQTTYAACIFAIMRRLASQVRLSTRADLDAGDRKRLMVEAAIVLGVPVFQLLFTRFDLAQRYVVGTLVGCSAVYDKSWPKAVVFDAPPAVFAVASVPFAYIAYARYRIVARAASMAFSNGVDVEACQRVVRTRRRRNRMCLSILVLYVPFMVFFLVVNLRDTLSGSRPYDYRRIRSAEGSPYPWHAILFVPSWLVPSTALNQPWIPIVTSFVIVAFFGATDDALKIWRSIGYRSGASRFAEYLGQVSRRVPGLVRHAARKLDEHVDDWMRLSPSPREKGFADLDRKYPKSQAFELPRWYKSKQDTYRTRCTDFSFDADLLLPSPTFKRPQTPSYSPAGNFEDWSSPQPLLPRYPPQAHQHHESTLSPSRSSGATIKPLRHDRIFGKDLPPLPTLESASALEDSHHIIQSIIPPRGSWLRYRGAMFLQSLRTPTLPRMPTLSSRSFSGMLSWSSRRMGSRRTASADVESQGETDQMPGSRGQPESLRVLKPHNQAGRSAERNYDSLSRDQQEPSLDAAATTYLPARPASRQQQQPQYLATASQQSGLHHPRISQVQARGVHLDRTATQRNTALKSSRPVFADAATTTTSGGNAQGVRNPSSATRPRLLQQQQPLRPPPLAVVPARSTTHVLRRPMPGFSQHRRSLAEQKKKQRQRTQQQQQQQQQQHAHLHETPQEHSPSSPDETKIWIRSSPAPHHPRYTPSSAQFIPRAYHCRRPQQQCSNNNRPAATPANVPPDSSTSFDTAIVRGVHGMSMPMSPTSIDDDEFNEWLTDYGGDDDDNSDEQASSTQDTARPQQRIRHSNSRRGRGKATAVPLLFGNASLVNIVSGRGGSGDGRTPRGGAVVSRRP